MSYIDYKYVRLIGARLEGFKPATNNSFNFRCPLCGDSQSNKRKTRAYVMPSKEDVSMTFYCHNCGASMKFDWFLKTIAHDLYEQYKIENFGNAMKSSLSSSIDDVVSIDSRKTAEILGNPLSKCLPLSQVDSGPAFERAEKRKLPRELYNEIFSAASIRDVTSRIDKYKDGIFPDVPAIVVPFFKVDGSYDYIQCRVAIDDYQQDLRFITLQLRDGPKIYGENRVNWGNPIYVLEGPFDSMFVDNSLAVAGANSGVSYILDRVVGLGKPSSNVVMLFDNDYGSNKHILQAVHKAVDRGLGVVLYDSKFFGVKDINQAIVNGWSRKEVNEYIHERTFSGMRAKLELSTLKKRGR